jgi:hypothetical protein
MKNKSKQSHSTPFKQDNNNDEKKNKKKQIVNHSTWSELSSDARASPIQCNPLAKAEILGKKKCEKKR